MLYYDIFITLFLVNKINYMEEEKLINDSKITIKLTQDLTQDLTNDLNLNVPVMSVVPVVTVNLTPLEIITQNKSKYEISNKYMLHREMLMSLIFITQMIVSFFVVVLIADAFNKNKSIIDRNVFEGLGICFFITIVLIIVFVIYSKIISYIVNKFVRKVYRPFIFDKNMETDEDQKLDKIFMPNNISYELYVLVKDYDENGRREFITCLVWFIRGFYVMVFVTRNEFDILGGLIWFSQEIYIRVCFRTIFAMPAMMRLELKLFKKCFKNYVEDRCRMEYNKFASGLV